MAARYLFHCPRERVEGNRIPGANLGKEPTVYDVFMCLGALP